MSAAGTGSLRPTAPAPSARARATELTLGWVRQVGAIAALSLACAKAFAHPTRRRSHEVVRQSAMILRAALPAAMLSIAAWGFAGPGLQAGNFLVTFGSIDRSGGFMVVAILREFGM